MRTKLGQLSPRVRQDQTTPRSGIHFAVAHWDYRWIRFPPAVQDEWNTTERRGPSLRVGKHVLGGFPLHRRTRALRRILPVPARWNDWWRLGNCPRRLASEVRGPTPDVWRL